MLLLIFLLSGLGLAQPPALADLSGTGPATLESFVVEPGWELHWNSLGERFELFVHVLDDGPVRSVVAQQGPGSGVERITLGGEIQLRIEAEGDWRVRVVPSPPEERASPASEGIVTRVEIYRVDFVRDDAGNLSERFTPVSEAVPGDVVEYRLQVRNETDAVQDAGRVVVTVPLANAVAYRSGSAGPPDGERVFIEFSGDGGRTFSAPPVLLEGEDGDARSAVEPEDYDHIRWTMLVPFEPGREETLFYRVEVR